MTPVSPTPRARFVFQFSSPLASRLEMHLPNKCFHLPNEFSPDPKLLFIFKSAIFHSSTYKHIFAIKNQQIEMSLIRNTYSVKPNAVFPIRVSRQAFSRKISHKVRGVSKQMDTTMSHMLLQCRTPLIWNLGFKPRFHTWYANLTKNGKHVKV